MGSASALGRWVAELREEDLLSGPHEDAAKEITRLRRERDLARQDVAGLIKGERIGLDASRLHGEAASSMTWRPCGQPFGAAARATVQSVHHELAENGIEVGRHRVARLMRGNGLSPKRKQKFKKTTDSQHNKAVASNLLDQNFSAEAPNEKWAADNGEGWALA